MLHESLNASCSNWLYWVHQHPLRWGPNASHCICASLTFNTQSDGDQRIAPVHTVSHEVIVSAPLRLRSLYENVWWSSELLCEGSTTFYSNKPRKAAFSVMSVGYKIQVVLIHHREWAKCLIDANTGNQTVRHTQSIYCTYTLFWTRKRLVRILSKRWNGAEKKASGLAVLTNGFQWLTSPLHQFYQTLIKYS